jgi:hypothetical protein
MTAQGHPRTIFQRAIERGNLLVAETVLRAEIPRPTLGDLLELTALIAMNDPRRHQRTAARWLVRYLDAIDGATLDDADLAGAALRALGSRHHGQALATLRDMADEAHRRDAPRRVT